ncbi:uncharacterized protein LOC112095345 [Morus notabilis]|uniref:uncharacterized protein LOC112095345 n=1 Tax=Morus notabilis TaxID=981085 RepID=UPI000CED6966|nr:uncharacterized protein LOC112095345 [Morus notabilis]
MAPTSNSEGRNIKEFNAISTRSAKNLDTPSTSTTTSSNEESAQEKEEPTKIPVKVPFPQALRSTGQVQENQSEILEHLTQLKINLPLLHVIKQVPAYAKVIKDLCTIKRKHHVKKTAFLTEQVSAVIEQKTPPKYKDPDLENLLQNSESESSDPSEVATISGIFKESQDRGTKFRPPCFQELLIEGEKPKSSTEEAPKVKLAQPPEGLKDAFLGDEDTFPVIISSKLDPLQEQRLIDILKEHNSRIKVKMKAAHDKQILRKNFEPNQRVHLYDSRLHLHPGKLRSRWTGTFIVKRIFPNGAVEVEDPTDGRIFKVNGQRLKNYLERVNQVEEIILDDPVYQP